MECVLRLVVMIHSKQERVIITIIDLGRWSKNKTTIAHLLLVSRWFFKSPQAYSSRGRWKLDLVKITSWGLNHNVIMVLMVAIVLVRFPDKGRGLRENLWNVHTVFFGTEYWANFIAASLLLLTKTMHKVKLIWKHSFIIPIGLDREILR